MSARVKIELVGAPTGAPALGVLQCKLRSKPTDGNVANVLLHAVGDGLALASVLIVESPDGWATAQHTAAVGFAALDKEPQVGSAPAGCTWPVLCRVMIAVSFGDVPLTLSMRSENESFAVACAVAISATPIRCMSTRRTTAAPATSCR